MGKDRVLQQVIDASANTVLTLELLDAARAARHVALIQKVAAGGVMAASVAHYLATRDDLRDANMKLSELEMMHAADQGMILQ